MGYKKSVWRTLALITQLGISMLTPIFLCVFLGWFLDEKFGWHTLIPLLILGILAGGQTAYRLAKHAIRDAERDRPKEEQEEK